MGEPTLQIIDAQLHDIGPRLAWDADDAPVRRRLLTELMLAWMDAVGVDATFVHAIDVAWAREAVAAVPERLALVVSMREPEAPDVAERIAELRATRGVVAARLSFGRLPHDPTGAAGEAKFRAGAFEPLFAACERNGLPLFCSAYGFPHLVGEIAAAHPALRLSVDHMGIAQPPLNPRESPPWKSLPGLLAIADRPNVYVKLCGAPVLSDEPYPFADTGPHIREILEAFGPERVMWASDIGRFEGRIGWDNQYPEAHGAYQGKHTYAEALLFIRASAQLTPEEKAQLLGGTARHFAGWPS